MPTPRVLLSVFLATIVFGVALALAAEGDVIADRVYGKPNLNVGSPCSHSASETCQPRSVAVDYAGRLYVADTSNNRVLGYSSPLTNSSPDLVIGQPDFSSTECNLNGDPLNVTASSLCSPVSVAVDPSNNLYVSDGLNNRVLEYNQPFSSDALPDRVFGQTNFQERTCHAASDVPTGYCGPDSLAVDHSYNLFVNDPDHSRVLVYESALMDGVPDMVIGQPDFTTGLCNHGQPVLQADSLCTPTGAAIDGANNFYVGDFNNNRVLRFNSPTTTDGFADVVYGDPNPNPGVCPPPTGTNLCGALGVDVDSTGNLWIAESGRHRVLGFKNAINDGPDILIGQDTYQTNDCNKFASVSAATLCAPLDAAHDSSGNIYVADWANSRALEYDSPLAASTPTPGPVGGTVLINSAQYPSNPGSLVIWAALVGTVVVFAASFFRAPKKR